MFIENISAIGNIIRKRRKEMGLTQKQAAGLCNVGVRFFLELENGKETLEIGKVLNVLNGFAFEVHLKERGIR